MPYRPSRSERGVPRGGRRHAPCGRALIRRAVAAADARAAIDGTRLAPRGAVSAAMLDAARACHCEACPRYVADAERMLAFDGTLKRESRTAERVGRAAGIGGGFSERALELRALEAAAEQRGGQRGVQGWHAKQRADGSANDAFGASMAANDNDNNDHESEA